MAGRFSFAMILIENDYRRIFFEKYLPKVLTFLMRMSIIKASNQYFAPLAKSKKTAPAKRSGSMRAAKVAATLT